MPAVSEWLLTAALLLAAFAVVPAAFDPLEPVRQLILSAVNTLALTAILWTERPVPGQRPESVLRYSRTGLLFGAYCAAGALSILNAPNHSEWLWKWLELLNIGIFYAWVGMESARGRIRFHIISGAICVIGLILALMGILQFFDLGFLSLPGHGALYGSMGNRNILSSALMLTLPFGAYTWYKSSGTMRICHGFAVSLTIAAIVLTRCRGVWIGMAVASIALALICRPLVIDALKKRLSRLRKTSGNRIAAALLLLIAVPGLSWLLSGDATIQPIFSNASLQERWTVWRQTLRMVASEPATGVGLGQWRIRYPEYAEDPVLLREGEHTLEARYQRPHNDFLWIAAETGILGGALFLGWFLTNLIAAAGRAAEGAGRHQLVIGAFIAWGLTAYGIDALLSFPRERVFHQMVLVMMAGVLLPAVRRTSGRGWERRKSLIPIMLAAMLSFVFTQTAWNRLQADLRMGEALRAFHAQEWEAVVTRIPPTPSRVYTLDPAGTPPLWYRGTALCRLARYAEAAADLRHALKQHPYHAHTWNNLGICYAATGRPAEAEACFRKASQLYPGMGEAAANLQHMALLAQNREQQDNDLY